MVKLSKPPQTSPKKTNDTARDLLLSAGKKLFAQKGLDGTTVKELAEKAGVNISLVSYHFSGKEGLYRACLQECGRESLALVQKLLRPPASLEDFRIRLRLFAGEMLEYFSSNTDHVRTIFREIESENSLLQRDSKDVFEQTFLRVFAALVDYFKAGQKSGFLRKDVDPQVLGVFFRGAISQLARTDFLNKRYFNNSITDPRYRERAGNQLVDIFLNGILRGAPPRELEQ